MDQLEYVGFWRRVVAHIIDSILVVIVALPLLFAAGVFDYAMDYAGLFADAVSIVVSWVLPPIAVILFWTHRQATPGKMAVAARIVDAETGEKPSTAQCIGRYFAYLPAILPLCLGLLWVAFDRRKQGWHDKLAGTVVVSTASE